MATTTPTTTAPRGRSGRMTFSLQRLPEPLLLEQDVVDPTWHRAMLIGFVIASIVVPALIGYVGYRMGASGESTSTVAPSAIHWKTYADCQRAYVLTLRQDPEGACDSLPH